MPKFRSCQLRVSVTRSCLLFFSCLCHNFIHLSSHRSRPTAFPGTAFSADRMAYFKPFRPPTLLKAAHKPPEASSSEPPTKKRRLSPEPLVENDELEDTVPTQEQRFPIGRRQAAVHCIRSTRKPWKLQSRRLRPMMFTTTMLFGTT